MRALILTFILSISSSFLQAETLKIVTGEFAPYSGENLNKGGVSTQVVKAIFDEVKQDISIEFIPWNRGMNNLKTGLVAGSFPWTKNVEREVDLLYSEPIHKYKLVSFVRKDSSLLTTYNLNGKKLCQPSGWDISFLDRTSAAKKITIERPISMESCLQMLSLGRVDVIVMNDHVGTDFINKLFPKNSPITGIDNEYFGKKFLLYFIVPKKYPNAKKIIADFNRGLALIKSNGKYENFVRELLKKETVKSSCGTCNHLGSL
ncbi:MAG: transporter substrate-binding domain-containing protein [Bacteriovorax sp.]|nr:transporter substrate-binding domain-containing protein [Bacteriovorax sp.]